MNQDLLQKRINDLRNAIEMQAAELNKLVGRLQEAELLLQYAIDKEKQALESADVIQ